MIVNINNYGVMRKKSGRLRTVDWHDFDVSFQTDANQLEWIRNGKYQRKQAVIAIELKHFMNGAVFSAGSGINPFNLIPDRIQVHIDTIVLVKHL